MRTPEYSYRVTVDIWPVCNEPLRRRSHRTLGLQWDTWTYFVSIPPAARICGRPFDLLASISALGTFATRAETSSRASSSRVDRLCSPRETSNTEQSTSVGENGQSNAYMLATDEQVANNARRHGREEIDKRRSIDDTDRILCKFIINSNIEYRY